MLNADDFENSIKGTEMVMEAEGRSQWLWRNICEARSLFGGMEFSVGRLQRGKHGESEIWGKRCLSTTRHWRIFLMVLRFEIGRKFKGWTRKARHFKKGWNKSLFNFWWEDFQICWERLRWNQMSSWNVFLGFANLGDTLDAGGGGGLSEMWFHLTVHGASYRIKGKIYRA